VLALSLPSLAKGEIPTLTDLRVQILGAPEPTDSAESAAETTDEAPAEPARQSESDGEN